MNIMKLIEDYKKVFNELTFTRSNAIGEITGLCIPYTEHILKLVIFGKDEKYNYDVAKWKDEIFNFLNIASLYYDLKGNKKLKARDYTDNFFFGLMETREEVERTFKRMSGSFIRKGYKIPKGINYESIFKNHKIFVEEVLKVFPEIEYNEILGLLNKHIVGKGE